MANINLIYHTSPVSWRHESTLCTYEYALQVMEERAAAIFNDKALELVWSLEHPPLYTAGTSANPRDMLHDTPYPIYPTGRGGQYTYHGPGQRVLYMMLDLSKRGKDVRAYVEAMEALIIASLAEFNVEAFLWPGNIGVWVNSHNKSDPKPAKVAAIGVRVRKWVSFHGLSINVAPNLSHYNTIVPCGISDAGVTSLQELNVDISMSELDKALKHHFTKIFAPLISEP